MSEKGLGRVKTALAMSPLAGGPSGVSGHDRGDQRLDPDDVHYPGQIIGENREGHLGGYFWKRFCEEVRRPHAGFHRAEWMFDGLAPLPHGQGIVVEAPLHFFQHVLMLPARNPPLLAGCAASFECTVAAYRARLATYEEIEAAYSGKMGRNRRMSPLYLGVKMATACLQFWEDIVANPPSS